MKLKYYFIGLTFCCGLGLSSCNDSFLDRIPKDQLSDDSFWKNSEDATKFVTGIYLWLPEPENHTIMTDCYTDNAIPVHVGAEQGSCLQERLRLTILTSCSSGSRLTQAYAAVWYIISISVK